jgi:Lactonase, 7-bladed beta-propeller
LLFPPIPDKQIVSATSFSHRDSGREMPAGGKRLGVQMSKKIGLLVALAAICALSLFLLNCGSSSSRPTGILYVLTQGNNGVGNNVSSFATDLNSGNLTLINSNAATCNPPGSSCGPPLDILLDPAGVNAFVLNQGSRCAEILNGQTWQCDTSQGASPAVLPTIYPYTIGGDGSLSAPLAAVTWTCAGLNLTPGPCSDLPVAMARDDAGKFLFVIDQGSFPYPGFPTPSATNPICPHAPTSQIDVCPSISVFAIQGSTLKLASGSPFYLSKVPTGLSAVTFIPSGSSTAEELLFVSNNQDICPPTTPPSCVSPSPGNDNTVSEYVVNSDGSLTEQSNSPYAVAANNPVSVFAVNTGGNAGGLFVYVGKTDSNGGDVYPFQVCTVVGNLGCGAQDVQSNLMTPLQQTCPEPPCTQVPPTAVGKDPVQMLVDPTKNFLYVLSEGANTVFGFQINTSVGTLASQNPANQGTGSQPVSMAIHPSVNNTGQFLYVSNSDSDSISVFSLSTTTGSMGSPNTVTAPATPSGLAAH